MSKLQHSPGASAWEEDFAFELRMRGARGTAIGDALATVRSFCFDSGQAAGQAFGDPIDYAAALIEDEAVPVTDFRTVRGTVVLAVLEFVGLLLTVDALSAWLTDAPLEVSGGTVVLTGAFALLLVVVCLRIDSLLRYLVRAPFLAVLAIVVGWGAVALTVGLLLDEPLFVLPAVPAAVVGLTALLVPPVVRQVRGGDRDEDPVVSPTGEVEEPGRGIAVATVVLNWMMPIAAAFFVVMWWLLG